MQRGSGASYGEAGLTGVHSDRAELEPATAAQDATLTSREKGGRGGRCCSSFSGSLRFERELDALAVLASLPTSLLASVLPNRLLDRRFEGGGGITSAPAPGDICTQAARVDARVVALVSIEPEQMHSPSRREREREVGTRRAHLAGDAELTHWPCARRCVVPVPLAGCRWWFIRLLRLALHLLLLVNLRARRRGHAQLSRGTVDVRHAVHDTRSAHLDRVENVLPKLLDGLAIFLAVRLAATLHVRVLDV